MNSSSQLYKIFCKGGEEIVKTNLLIALLVAAMVLSAATFSFALQTQTINVSATVDPQPQALNITVTPVNSSTNQWGTGSSSLPIAFGTLSYNSSLGIFLPTNYYAVDIGVVDNSGNVWVLTHEASTVTNGSANLDSNINVTFVKQLTSATTEWENKVTYGESNNVQYNKTQLSGGWLRIYYGIATGNRNLANGSVDATNATPITIDKPTGTYQGQVTLRLTP